MPDWEKEGREAKQKLVDFEKRIKSLEDRLNAQWEETIKIRKRLDELEGRNKPNDPSTRF